MAAEIEIPGRKLSVRRLHKTSGTSRYVTIPSSVVDMWEERFGNILEVDVFLDHDGKVTITPRGMVA